ncbi:MAG: hypothetical protein NT150_13865 [Bacteroidetes bacterium]|nr:hypothetical protein [Bacteroidota bacterium]
METTYLKTSALFLHEILYYTISKGLNNKILSKKDEIYVIEISYTEEQKPIIVELYVMIEKLRVFFLTFTLSSALYLSELERLKEKECYLKRNAAMQRDNPYRRGSFLRSIKNENSNQDFNQPSDQALGI